MKTTLGVAIFAVPMMLACGPTTPQGVGGTGGTGGNPGVGGTGGSGPSTQNGLPCNIDRILKAKCQACHGSTPAGGAPFPLTSYAEVKPRVDRIKARAIDLFGQTGSMPPPGANSGDLTTSERDELAAWIAGGAPQSGDTCNNPNPTIPVAGIEHLPCTPKYFFLANGGGFNTKEMGSGAKYPVGGNYVDRYIDFSFPSPFAPGEQAVAWAPVIDNPAIIHHYILYGGPQRTFVAGWAPGGVNAVMADDLGLVLDYPNFTLQVHYNNLAPTPTTDKSGVAFCTTNTPRPNPVGIVTLGSVLISLPPRSTNVKVTGQCSNLSSQPITIVAGSAHMHKLGVAFHTEMFGSNGASKAVITDVPLGKWNFDNQKPQPARSRIKYTPGDRLVTSCTYTNPSGIGVGFGEGTNDEMCFDFMSVYPYSAANKLCMF